MTAMGEPRIASDRNDGRSAMARVSDARPFKPYVYRGGGEPAAVTAARQRARATALMETAGPGPDDISYEWRREQLDEEADDAKAAGPPIREIAAAAPLPAQCQRCNELEATVDGLRAEIRALIAARGAAEEPAPTPVRCRKCGYMTGTTGHKVMCDA